MKKFMPYIYTILVGIAVGTIIPSLNITITDFMRSHVWHAIEEYCYSDRIHIEWVGDVRKFSDTADVVRIERRRQYADREKVDILYQEALQTKAEATK